jgi:hypothetical protein
MKRKEQIIHELQDDPPCFHFLNVAKFPLICFVPLCTKPLTWKVPVRFYRNTFMDLLEYWDFTWTLPWICSHIEILLAQRQQFARILRFTWKLPNFLGFGQTLRSYVKTSFNSLAYCDFTSKHPTIRSHIEILTDQARPWICSNIKILLEHFHGFAWKLRFYANTTNDLLAYRDFT